MLERFKNRRAAGRLLAQKLGGFSGREDVVVLALPRGGVPVGYEVARELGVPFDIFVVRKLGVPGHEELALGAIASGGVRVLSQSTIKAFRIDGPALDAVIAKEKDELERRERLYRGARPPIEVSGKTVIVVDDGLATGATMQAAVRALKEKQPRQVIVAVPVCAASTCAQLERDVDVWCICALTPEPFYAVGLWYEDFGQTTDEEVELLLARADAGEVAARHFV